MTPIAICFSGRIAIGKTSVSKALAEELRCPWTGFGSYIRRVALTRAIDVEDRDQLQELGELLIQEHGFEWLCREVIAAAHWTGDRPLVIDGIRHAEAFQTIARLLSPHRVVLIHLTIDEEMLRERSKERGLEPGKRATWESHSTEQQVISTLPNIADLTVDANMPLDEITRRITGFLQLETDPRSESC